MANEIFCQVKLIWDYKLASQIVNVDRTFRVDALAGTRYNNVVQVVGSGAWENLDIGDLAKTHMTIRNMDDTNYVMIGIGTTEVFRILPGAVCLVYLTHATPVARADTADVDIEIIGVEGSG